MIKIKPSSVADTRTCDWSKVTKDQLLQASGQHIGDVIKGINFFIAKLRAAALEHDFDKITDKGLDGFYNDFQTGFEQQNWYDNHKQVNRHHLQCPEGIRDDVNLIDVLEYLTDCIMAGLGRSGKVTTIEIDSDCLMRAFNNTCDLLISQVTVEDQ